VRKAQWLGLLAILMISACGDPPTEDHRGYTKAPLERPGLIIRSGEVHPLEEYGRPILPVASEVAAPAPAAAPTPTATPAGS
jgi:hypothetical protein